MEIGEIGEIDLIDKIARETKIDRTVIKGIGDDTAVLKYSNKEYLLFTTDMLLEGVHFTHLRPRGASKVRLFYNIGWKSLACSISDIAAMGGIPQYCLVSLGLPPNLELDSLKQLYSGIKTIARKFKINVVGGDTIKSRRLIIDIALLGRVLKEKLVLRSGAKKGDAILVTGSLGEAILGKHLAFTPLEKFLTRSKRGIHNVGECSKYSLTGFTPRLKEAQYLVNNFKIHSMIDISDGLILDLWRILKQSGKGAKIFLEKIPISAVAKRGKNGLKKALYGGEDFELLFTASKRTAQKIAAQKLARIIGEINDRRNIIESSDGRKLRINGYRHF